MAVSEEKLFRCCRSIKNQRSTMYLFVAERIIKERMWKKNHLRLFCDKVQCTWLLLLILHQINGKSLDYCCHKHENRLNFCSIKTKYRKVLLCRASSIVHSVSRLNNGYLMRIWHAQCAFTSNCQQSSSLCSTRTKENNKTFRKETNLNKTHSNNQQFEYQIWVEIYFLVLIPIHYCRSKHFFVLHFLFVFCLQCGTKQANLLIVFNELLSIQRNMSKQLLFVHLSLVFMNVYFLINTNYM